MNDTALRLVLALALASPTAASAASETHAGAADTLAFVGVSVLPMDRERVLEGQTVVVQGDRIVRIGPAGQVEVPDGATRIDATGKFLLPGLNEMHGHIPNQPEPARDALALFVANGVTTVRGMLGHPSHLELRRAVLDGDVTGPTLFLASPVLGGNIGSPATAARLVREYEEAGYDLLKVHEGLSRHSYDAIAATAKEVGIPFGGHVSDNVGLARALEAGQSTIDHLDNYLEAVQSPEFASTAGGSSASRLHAVVEATRRAGVAVVPTQALWRVLITPPPDDELRQRPELRYVAPATVDQWLQQVGQIRGGAGPDDGYVLAFRDTLLGALHEAGVRVLLGSDAPQLFSVPGFSLVRELQVMTEAGLSAYDVLEAGTRLPAEHFGVGEEVGTVAEGKRADLILLDGNPLEDLERLRDPAGVVLRGRWIPREELRELLSEVEARAAGG